VAGGDCVQKNHPAVINVLTDNDHKALYFLLLVQDFFLCVWPSLYFNAAYVCTTLSTVVAMIASFLGSQHTFCFIQVSTHLLNHKAHRIYWVIQYIKWRQFSVVLDLYTIQSTDISVANSLLMFSETKSGKFVRWRDLVLLSRKRKKQVNWKVYFCKNLAFNLKNKLQKTSASFLPFFW
jgi:hypothetical protein